MDITQKAKDLCREFPIAEDVAKPFENPVFHRIMEKDKNGAVKRRDYRTGAIKDAGDHLKVKILGVDGFALGKQNVDLRYLEQLIDSEQTAALGQLLKYAVENLVDGKRSIADVVEYLQVKLEQEGMQFTAGCGTLSGGLAIPRKQEIYACFNRYRI